jgi:hypothetical protein
MGLILSKGISQEEFQQLGKVGCDPPSTLISFTLNRGSQQLNDVVSLKKQLSWMRQWSRTR